MKIDETLYHEFANWKLENDELLKKIITDAPDIFYRFKHVLDVIEYYYDKLIDDSDYTNDDDLIFKTGYYYLLDHLEYLKSVLKDVYNNDYKELNNHSKEINLLLNTIDFQAEVINSLEPNDDADVKRLLGYDSIIYEYINKKELVPENIFLELDELTLKLFTKLNLNYYPISDIYLEIADELNIL